MSITTVPTTDELTGASAQTRHLLKLRSFSERFLAAREADDQAALDQVMAEARDYFAARDALKVRMKSAGEAADLVCVNRFGRRERGSKAWFRAYYAALTS